MKKIGFSLIMLSFAASLTFAQNQEESRIPLIGSVAPSFTAESTQGTITFPEDFGHKWKILFSHPKDFTPVCSSEIIEIANLQPVFDDLKVKVAVLSTDNLSQHESWKESLETVNYKDRLTPQIKFPIIDDNDKVISKAYGMLHTPTSTTKDVRGVFIIDPNDIVQAVFFYPLNVGRNFDEIVRTVQALQTDRQYSNVATPANWNPGDDVILTYLSDKDKEEMNSPNSNIYEVVWYMVLQKGKTP